MNSIALAILPKSDPDQELRLKRFFFAGAAYAINFGFVLTCWAMNYLGTRVVANYLLLVLAINVGIYLIIRSHANKRFSDPSLTILQMLLASVSGLYLMYHSEQARSTFLLLGVAMFVFGMFRFRTRQFVFIAFCMLGGYALVIGLLAFRHPDRLNLTVEILEWTAYLATLIQLSLLGGYIGNLRRKVRDNTLELEKRNAELESALLRISDMAVRDELTGVYNRRYLTERIAEEAQRAMRSGAVFCIGVIDIDLFKRVNDTHGHLAGDEVLRMVAKTVSGTVRQTDFFGRFGGEEFVMVLTDTPLEGAMVSAERVRQTIEGMQSHDLGLRVTVSIGVAEHARGAAPEDTFKRADAALYHAKETGRNRCMSASRE